MCGELLHGPRGQAEPSGASPIHGVGVYGGGALGDGAIDACTPLSEEHRGGETGIDRDDVLPIRADQWRPRRPTHVRQGELVDVVIQPGQVALGREALEQRLNERPPSLQAPFVAGDGREHRERDRLDQPGIVVGPGHEGELFEHGVRDGCIGHVRSNDFLGALSHAGGCAAQRVVHEQFGRDGVGDLHRIQLFEQIQAHGHAILCGQIAFGPAGARPGVSRCVRNGARRVSHGHAGSGTVEGVLERGEQFVGLLRAPLPRPPDGLVESAQTNGPAQEIGAGRIAGQIRHGVARGGGQLGGDGAAVDPGRHPPRRGEPTAQLRPHLIRREQGQDHGHVNAGCGRFASQRRGQRVQVGARDALVEKPREQAPAGLVAGSPLDSMGEQADGVEYVLVVVGLGGVDQDGFQGVQEQGFSGARVGSRERVGSVGPSVPGEGRATRLARMGIGHGVERRQGAGAVGRVADDAALAQGGDELRRDALTHDTAQILLAGEPREHAGGPDGGPEIGIVELPGGVKRGEAGGDGRDGTLADPGVRRGSIKELDDLVPGGDVCVLRHRGPGQRERTYRVLEVFDRLGGVDGQCACGLRDERGRPSGHFGQIEFAPGRAW